VRNLRLGTTARRVESAIGTHYRVIDESKGEGVEPAGLSATVQAICFEILIDKSRKK